MPRSHPLELVRNIGIAAHIDAGKTTTTERIVYINKMDRLGADFYSVVDKIKQRLGANGAPIQIPIGAESNYTGYIDLIRMKATIYMSDDGKTSEEREIPEEMKAEAAEHREK